MATRAADRCPVLTGPLANRRYLFCLSACVPDISFAGSCPGERVLLVYLAAGAASGCIGKHACRHLGSLFRGVAWVQDDEVTLLQSLANLRLRSVVAAKCDRLQMHDIVPYNRDHGSPWNV